MRDIEESGSIVVEGARVHNLKNVNIAIPHNKLVVITGLSGSGKSSLAFDTICTEAQRRYFETLSIYARQFLGSMERPDVDSISGLNPVISIEQKSTGNNPRSTVGTMTEIYDFLRLLYAKASTAYSPATGKKMVRYNDEQLVSLIIERYGGAKIVILSPLIAGRKGHYRDLFEQLIKRGFSQARVDGEIFDLGKIAPLDRYKPHFIDLVVDKIVPAADNEKRIRSSVIAALNQGDGSLAILDIETQDLKYYSKNLICPESGLSFAEPAPHTFSFNSPQGYCPNCKGMGELAEVDMDKIIPDSSKSVAKGGVIPIGSMRENTLFGKVEGLFRRYGVSIHTPIEDLPKELMDSVLYGTDELFRVGEGKLESYMTDFEGVISSVNDLYKSYSICPTCNGNRLNPAALNFKIDGKSISEVSSMNIGMLHRWFSELTERMTGRERIIASDILKELKDRSQFLLDIGLDYLTLNRNTNSLSGGEGQRIRLATQIGSKLVNVLYVLDEPSIGLHQRDNIKLINSLKRLRDEGNTILVVEHDEEIMRSADWLIDMGPGAGERGGRVLFSDSPDKIDKLSKKEALSSDSLTLQYLKKIKRIEIPEIERAGNGLFIELLGASGNNLKDVDIKIPLGMFVGVSGVSGSGKSSLINRTLMPILSNHFYRGRLNPLPYKEIKGIDNIDKLIVVDQSPIGKSYRSNPATYTNLFTEIRKLFESTPDAKIRGFKAGHFSFNVKGGRCEACKGVGRQLVEMNFLPPLFVTCKECNGRRYKPDTLSVKYKGRSINEVLEMTVSQSLEFFSNIPSITQRLRSIEEVGLGYIRIGQTSNTLSGGESQRIKLSAELSKRGSGNTLYILDEPTTGLHFDDIKALLDVLQRLVDMGNTVLIIEHNPDVLRSVDYLFEMGPEGGDKGGEIISQGAPRKS